MAMKISIAGRMIGDGEPPYIIAELSANHGGNLDRAKKIIKIAAEAKAHAIKFQAYTADSLTLNCESPHFIVTGESLWAGRRLHELYESAATPYSWFPELFAYARDLGITPFATAFGVDAIEMLEPLEPAAYKIASFEAVDLELIAAVARTKRPIIISTGLCTEEEVALALETAKSNGARDVVLLKCSSSYPAPLSESNLSAISYMQKRFGVPIGYSDHTMGIAVPIAACALGACVIEKHVIDSRTPPTADSEFSALPDELNALTNGCYAAFVSRGKSELGPTESELKSIVFRRSLFTSQNIKDGEPFTRENVRSVRPGFGLAPKFLPDILGSVAARDIPAGTPLDWSSINPKSKID